ncbi:DUF692 domain-containing protein [Silvanigrella aquatica]|uniref:Uncharacterized protein n=1 Tax=Silvanigrella aquatica TaxID=1915309 RepID=A0A1L4CXP8_9BACT|nr:DUF692 domain-containing protein [Silvanigrella aquatica]APJ02731.1 hypothetical protein AXG55_01835 [Silvanigrella aquatica]
MLSGFRDLGVGVGLRPKHYNAFLTQKTQCVSWVEVISENYMNWNLPSKGYRPLNILEKVRSRYDVILHGVSLNIGSTDRVNMNYLKSLKDLIDKIEPAWVSDHLCWTGVQGENYHDLLPLPYTEEVLNLVVSKLHQVQDFLGQRILIENPSTYLQFKNSEMSEIEFLNLLTQNADCGLLLDINNVYVNSRNHSFNPLEYLKALPKDYVCQIHLAGHSNRGTHLIDTHDAPICDEVWELYRWSVSHFKNVSTMVERDDNIPEWEELQSEILKIAQIRKQENEQVLNINSSKEVC